LDIVHKSFITLGKPLRMQDCNVHIRDTLLLAPAGNRSLESLGKLYGGDYNKIKVSSYYKQNMHKLLLEDRKFFTDYAVQDAMITLKHANEMEDFNFNLNKIGLPLSLTSLGESSVELKWKASGYSTDQYQPSNESLLGKVESVQTPKGLMETKAIG
jgi:hypothetical protein